MTAPALLCAGVPVATGERIGRGGEGEVYAVRDDPSRAIKLYLQPDAAHEAKVRAMIVARLAEKCVSVAFPLQIVHHADGSLGGFTMRRVSDSQPIFELFASGSRRERFPRADWAFLVRTATNVARVVAQVHAGGAVIGDINSAGFLVSQRATVTLIDADSFQVAGHRCRVGMPEYTPAELQGMRFGEVDRTVDHDAFGLAVMIFQLLALGRHPYAGVRNGRSVPLETAITQGRFAYSLIRNVGSMPPPAALTLRDLPLGIRTLLRARVCIENGCTADSLGMGQRTRAARGRAGPLTVQAIAFLDIGPDRLGCDLRSHQSFAKAVEDTGFQFVARDRSVVRAGLRRDPVGADEPALPAPSIRASLNSLVPRLAWPRIAVSAHNCPLGQRMPPAFRRCAIARGLKAIGEMPKNLPHDLGQSQRTFTRR